MIGYSPNVLSERLFSHQDRILPWRKKKTHSVHETRSVENIRRSVRNTEEVLTQSLEYDRLPLCSNSSDSDKESFIQTVTVVPPHQADGKYSIYPGVHDRISVTKPDYRCSSDFLDSLKYEHNISNPELRLQRFENENFEWLKRKQVFHKQCTQKGFNIGNTNSKRDNFSGNYHNALCHCGQYHTHTFKSCNTDMTKLVLSENDSEPNVAKKTSEMSSGTERQTIICKIFWEAQLAFSEYKHGDKPLEFRKLWPPKYKEIQSRLTVGIEDTDLRGAFWELCVLTMVDGPVSVLQALVEMKYLRIDYQFDNDPGLLHLACVLRNVEAVQLITQLGVSSKIKDKSGKTAEEVCFCHKTRKHLPLKLQTTFLADRNKNQSVVEASLQDKEAIFELALKPKSLYELQKKLQMFEFQVNREMKDGDYLVHIAAKAGMCQLPLLMSLVHIQKADINLCNTDGMTPLMIFVQEGDCNMCDTLLCVLGADPDVTSTVNGRTALHYAVIHGHSKIVNCLVRRGADVNVEDSDQRRPDDLMLPGNVSEDCRLIIQQHRSTRSQELSAKVISDAIYPVDLRPTDLLVVDEDDNTLIMVAAQNNRAHNLEVLLRVCVKTINAQHNKTGLTALAMAARSGNEDCCEILLLAEANPGIPDMTGYLPLHYAVLNNQEKIINVFKKHFPLAYVGIFKALKYSKSSSIYDKLKEMFDKRQNEMVQPELRVSAINGDAGKLFCLLEEGDNVNFKGGHTGQAPLLLAIENHHVDVLKLLVERGADLKKRDVNKANTVLHIVSQTGDFETAKYLMQFCETGKKSTSKIRLDVNAVNNDKQTALQIAAERGNINLIRLLIEYGATTALLNSQGTLFTSAEFEGARILIEGHRNEHTYAVMKLVSDKSKKAVSMLSKIWVPRFDHNLRDKNGDTPLMVACRNGRQEIVAFLLRTAVYANQITDDDGEHSDDSGVQDFQPWKSHLDAGQNEELLKSLEKTGEFELPVGATYNTVHSLNPGSLVNNLGRTLSIERGANMSSFLTDVERPKGLFIYHDGIVSHVCAVNLFDGNTPLHRTIEGGDFAEIATMLIEADSAVINMQNDAGLTPVHLACKHGRRKTLEKLLMVNGLDLSLVTLNCHQPEEMTTNKTLIKMIQKARKAQPTGTNQRISESSNVNLTLSLASDTSHGGASTINFDRIEDIYTSMRTECKLSDDRQEDMFTSMRTEHRQSTAKDRQQGMFTSMQAERSQTGDRKQDMFTSMQTEHSQIYDRKQDMSIYLQTEPKNNGPSDKILEDSKK